MEDFARFMVLAHLQNQYPLSESAFETAKYLNMELTQEDIDYGIKYVFYEHRKLKSAKDELERKLFSLRLFIANFTPYIERNHARGHFEDEVECAKDYINGGVKELKKMGVVKSSFKIF